MLFFKLFPLILLPVFQGFFWLLQFMAVFSVFLGNVYAFSEVNFRRFWAVASIGHMGQILLALLLGGTENLVAAAVYLFLYLSANIFF